jgi:hypothetical protein
MVLLVAVEGMMLLRRVVSWASSPSMLSSDRMLRMLSLHVPLSEVGNGCCSEPGKSCLSLLKPQALDLVVV